MKESVCIPQELFLEMYKYLVLYGLLHGLGEIEKYNTFLKNIESHLPEEDKF